MKLSRREQEVAGLVAEGLTNREIARRLFVSERTAEYHVEQIRNKLGFRRRSQIAAWVRERSPSEQLPGRPHNLPSPLSSFVGRRRELREVKSLIATHRLVTLTGPAGVGKTRLALQAAGELLETFVDGVWMVEFAELSDSNLVREQMAAALNLGSGSEPVTGHSLEQNLKERSVLIILDNCEHLIDATAQLSDAVLRACKDARILATSRNPLRVEGELVWRVPALRESQELFCERAALAGSDLEPSPVVAEVCRLVDGMPLAVELAAARLGVMSIEDLRAALSDHLGTLSAGRRTVHPRQQSLRTAIEWSYNLLSPTEQLLFGRLAVFAGGFDLEAATSICAQGLPEGREVVMSLADKSLLNPATAPSGRTRYSMLRTIRDFGLERLQTTEELEALGRRHFDYFLELAESGGHLDLTLPAASARLDRLAEDNDNIRASLEWGRDHDPDALLRLAGALGPFWLVRGSVVESRAWLETALGLSRLGGNVRADALWQAAIVAARQDDVHGSETFGIEAAAIYKDIGNLGQLARVLSNLAVVTEDRTQRRRLLEQGLGAARMSNDPAVIGLVLSLLGETARAEGDYSAARELHEEGLASRRAAGNDWGIARSLVPLGYIALEAGDRQDAVDRFREALIIVQNLRDKSGLAMTFDSLARLNDDPVKALLLAAAAQELRTAIGEGVSASRIVTTDDRVAEFRERLGRKAGAVESAGRAMTLEEAITLARGEAGLPPRD